MMTDNLPETITETVSTGRHKFKKGDPRPVGAGKVKGQPNKLTILGRKGVEMLVEGNIPRMQGWLDEIAADPKHGPVVAFKLLSDMLEYHIPKLARTEHVGDGGGPVVIRASREDEHI